jgi:hypothetical protein
MPMPESLSEYSRGRLAPFLNLTPPVATAEHLAASITFLLSDDAVNINGAILPSDGGWSVQLQREAFVRRHCRGCSIRVLDLSASGPVFP